VSTLRRSAFYGLCLLGGALLVAATGLTHPRLAGDGASQLAAIAAAPAWRSIHWALLFGLPLILTGLLGVVQRHLETPGASMARAGAVVAAFAIAIWALNILFMVGAGWNLAQIYATGRPGLAATHAIFVYDMLHPFGLAAERLATFGLGIALYLFGWAVWNGKIWPRWQAVFALLTGAVCVVVALVVNEASPNPLYAAQGIVIAWCAATGAKLLL
jgi:hypothetical protein